MKRNFAYALYQHCGNMQRLMSVMEAILEHHFGNHDHCDESWCPFLKCKDDKSKQDKLKYRSKVLNKKMYEDALTHHTKNISYEKLNEICHDYSTNKCESTMSVITKFLPKNRYYAKTRMVTAVACDSAGYEGHYQSLFDELCIDLTPVTRAHLQSVDKKRQSVSAYKVTPQARSQRAGERVKKISKLILKNNFLNNGQRKYKSGMAAPGGELDTTVETTGFTTAENIVISPRIHDVATKVKATDTGSSGVKRKVAKCASCGQDGHSRSTNMACANYSK